MMNLKLRPSHSGRKKNTLKRTHLACRRVRDHKDRQHGVLALYKRTKSYETGWTETLAALQRGRQHPVKSKADFFRVKVFQELAALKLIKKLRFDDIRRL
jgi:spore coat polysaccharide biosynthesis protein SpsF (cytidylyltransferase family)